ncbi:MAG: sulfatase-like hydrolase/transferase [Chloroflexota bacterium]
MTKPTAQRPNIIIITTDQQRTDSLSCYGSDFTHTPNFDRLASEGVRLDRAYCTNPVCTPSRVSLFTGKQVSRHGAWNVGVNCDEEQRMISHLLTDEGYRTHYIGKAHFQAFNADRATTREAQEGWATGYDDGWDGPYYGFQTVELAHGHTTYGISGHYGAWLHSQASAEEIASWSQSEMVGSRAFGCEARDWSIPLKYHNSVWTADRTISFLQEQVNAQPFLLAIGFQDPHHPHAVPTEFTNRVEPNDVPLPDYIEGELEERPTHFMTARRGELEQASTRGAFPMAGQGRGHDYRGIPEAEARLGRAYYYSMVKLIDEQCGRIFDMLDELGMADNTIVIVTSDHGELLGDHGLWMKGPFMYEQLINIPLLIRYPNGFSSGQATSSLFSLVDVVPTCLAAAGVGIPADVDGVNMLPMLCGEVDDVRESVLVETVDDPQKLRLKTIVTETHKLTWYAGQTGDAPSGELVDLVADPAEKVNRWHDPAYAAVKMALLGQLLDYAEPLAVRSDRVAYA